MTNEKNPVIDILRVLAQFFVVGAHVIYMIDWPQSPLFAQFALPLVRNSTMFFVLMSGYLFALGLPDFEFKKLIRKRFQSVVIPYLICLVPMILIYAFNQKYQTDLQAWLQLLLTGHNSINRALWFFPLILTFYLLTPISAFFYKKESLFLMVLTFTFVISLLVHRPFAVYRLHHSILYFLFPYYAGMALFRYQRQIFHFLKTKHVLMLILLGLIFAFQFYWGTDWDTRRGYQSYKSFNEITWARWDISILQKLLVFVLSFYYLSTSAKALKFFEPVRWFSPYCFGIHLYHGYIITGFSYFFMSGPTTEVIWGFLISWIAFFFVMAGLVSLAAEILQQRSKYFFGH